MTSKLVLVPLDPSHEMAEKGWIAFYTSDKPAIYNQVRDGIAAAIADRHPVSPDEVEGLARVLCEADDENPDELVYPGTSGTRPRWKNYLLQAKAAFYHFGAKVE